MEAPVMPRMLPICFPTNRLFILLSLSVSHHPLFLFSFYSLNQKGSYAKTKETDEAFRQREHMGKILNIVKYTGTQRDSENKTQYIKSSREPEIHS